MIIEKEKIQKAKEKLGNRNALLMSELLGVQEYDPVNMKGLCPFHDEDTPSFVYNKKNYTMHCFGCGVTVDVLDAYMRNGHTFVEAVKYLFEQAEIKYNFGELGVKTKRAFRYPKRDETGDNTKVYQYLNSRKISEETADYLDIQQDSRGNCVFHYYDTNDVLTLVKYRPSHKIGLDANGKKEIKTWKQPDTDTAPILFNMNRVNTSSPLLITEGELDCAAAIEAGYTNAVSIPFGAHNYHWIAENWDWLEQFDNIIVCSDNDDAGNDMRKEVINRLGAWRTRFVEIPVSINDKAIKDLNELLYYGGKDAVMDAILNAKDTPVDSVVDFSDIQNINMAELDGIQTGFKQLDKALMKLFYGTFNIITGINGAGKSSFVSQLVCQCLEQGKNAFVYSGELPNFQTKNWMDYILAGQYNISEYDLPNNNSTDAGDNIKHYIVKSPVLTQIDDYYRNRLFIYKDSLSHSADAILDAMEATARKYGCKLFVIDNLTSVSLGGNKEEKYMKQEEFVTKLITFANKFNVVVLLVVHPHKMDTMRRMTKMDIQGISTIIDLAHRIISLYRVQDRDRQPNKYNDGYSCDVLCDILKDRMRGYEGKQIELYYDVPSRRFFTCEDDLKYSYSWDKEPHDMDLPFGAPQLIKQPF